MAEALGAFVKNLLPAAKTGVSSSAATGGFASFQSNLAGQLGLGASVPRADVPYTKWYRVWERTSPSDFKTEATILPFLLILLVVHLWGTRANRARARTWATVHGDVLKREYAAVGTDVAAASKKEGADDSILQERSVQEYISYATGRSNVAFLDIKLTLYKRYNPFTWLLEFVLSTFFESFRPPAERVVTIVQPFDGKEKEMLSEVAKRRRRAQEVEIDVKNKSSFEGFVWAIVQKNTMNTFRNGRYDATLTNVKDNNKLPSWATVMSESGEITDALLTNELCEAVKSAGEDKFEHLIISDMPIEKPRKLKDFETPKHITLSMLLPSGSDAASYDATLPLFTYAVSTLPDLLPNVAHFPGPVVRKLKFAREDESKRLRKIAEDEKAEERKLAADKEKKEERDRKLNSLSAEEQKKFLEKEKDKEMRKANKKMTRRG